MQSLGILQRADFLGVVIYPLTHQIFDMGNQIIKISKTNVS
jgi:hypothetical protein